MSLVQFGLGEILLWKKNKPKYIVNDNFWCSIMTYMWIGDKLKLISQGNKHMFGHGRHVTATYFPRILS